jgi:hypothetical protein
LGLVFEDSEEGGVLLSSPLGIDQDDLDDEFEVAGLSHASPGVGRPTQPGTLTGPAAYHPARSRSPDSTPITPHMTGGVADVAEPATRTEYRETERPCVVCLTTLSLDDDQPKLGTGALRNLPVLRPQAGKGCRLRVPAGTRAKTPQNYSGRFRHRPSDRTSDLSGQVARRRDRRGRRPCQSNRR